MNLEHMRIKVFLDSGGTGGDLKYATDPLVKGFTTNPTLFRKLGVDDYEGQARALIKAYAPKPISLEVFADDWDGMAKQARIIASWGPNVWVKIPVTNTKGESTAGLVRMLAGEGLKINVTAVFSMSQVVTMIDALGDKPGIISIFAGRIADTGRDPSVTIRSARGIAPQNIDILWASPREVFNIWEAEKAGADIITCGPDILSKLSLAGKNLEEFSRETVAMFKRDADAAGYQIHDPNSYGVSSFG